MDTGWNRRNSVICGGGKKEFNFSRRIRVEVWSPCVSSEEPDIPWAWSYGIYLDPSFIYIYVFCSTQFDSGNSLENNTIVWNFVLKSFLPISPECLLTPLQVMQMRDSPVLDFSGNRCVKWSRWHSSITGNYYKFSGQESASDLVSCLKQLRFLLYWLLSKTRMKNG